MKYLVMIQGSKAGYDALSGQANEEGPAWSEKDLEAMYAFMGDLNNDLAESGELVDAQGLTSPAHQRAVSRGADGRVVVTDGPFSETKELLAGYWVLDCESLERVTEIAERITECPQPEGAPQHPVIIRPIGSGGGDV
ncbi:YciI family protein [Streptomyces indicus]|uniref:Uncharacterized conserved protein n=1 Tax=Streptomyces indicus TaxID=417292 RepID=A0A1G8WN20_9ACTN|nr:YciI family protein [Streptomyces indicus]SDJ79778.1 Uncharacterized conserved protein [Streptomyces indicus]